MYIYIYIYKIHIYIYIHVHTGKSDMSLCMHVYGHLDAVYIYKYIHLYTYYIYITEHLSFSWNKNILHKYLTACTHVRTVKRLCAPAGSSLEALLVPFSIPGCSALTAVMGRQRAADWLLVEDECCTCM